jgi:NhaP-type Na+/H+ or K+/H+ antiporter
MINRIAGVMALLAFVVCLVVGGLGADNTFATTIERALTAMAVTLVIGLVLGAMARKMLEENLKSTEEKMKKNWTAPTQGDR